MKSVSYRDLEVWKKAIVLAKRIYELTEQFPAREVYGLSSQLRRSAVSVAANIAEGQARNSKKEFKQFLSVSLGSLSELETLLTIASETSYIKGPALDDLLKFTDEITRMLKGLQKHLALKS